MDGAREYTCNKLISLGLPLAIIIVSWFSFSEPVEQWRFLLLLVVTIGYTHYLIGGYYQLKSYTRKHRPQQYYIWFGLLTIIATGVWWWCWSTDRMVELAIFMIPYFVAHGFFNEQTFVARQLGTVLPPGIIGSITIWLAAVTTLSFLHPSAFFDKHYEYQFQTAVTAFQFSYPQAESIVWWVIGFGLLGLVVAAVIMGHVLYRRQYLQVSLPIAVIGLGLTGLYLYMGTFNYVYLLFFLLMYHFITWMIYSGVRFYERSPTQLGWYLAWHLLIIGAVVAMMASVVVSTVSDQVAFMAMNSYLFLLLTTIHITTSFINETWFQRAVGLR